jgi:type IV pilus assembly protein PilM
MGVFTKLTGSHGVIGLDIGSSAIKVVQLEVSKEGLALHKAGIAPTPREGMKGGVVTNPLAVAQAVRGLLEALKIEADLAVAGVMGPTVVLRQVELPVMSERQLRKSLAWEAKNYMSFPVEDSVLECQILDRGSSRTGQMEVMLVAAPRDMVYSLVETIEVAGLEPAAVEVEPLAGLRGLSGMAQQARGEAVALVGMGASYTDISIIKDKAFILSRVIPIAGNSFTQAISEALEIEFSEANHLKETAMTVVTSEEARAELDPASQQASRAVEPLLDELVRELRRSFAYHDYQQKLPETEEKISGVSKVLLSGGGAKLANIGAYLEAQLGVPVEVASIFSDGMMPTRGVSRDYLEAHAPTLVIGTGLALRELVAGRRSRVKLGRSHDNN